MSKENWVLGRQHRIHKLDESGKQLCNVKGGQCFDKEWTNVECKYCLRKKESSQK